MSIYSIFNDIHSDATETYTLEMAMIDYDYIYTTESVEDVATNIKEAIRRIIVAFKEFVKRVKVATDSLMEKMNLSARLMMLKSTLKRYPEMGDEKIIAYDVSHTVANVQSDLRKVKNMMYKASKLRKNRMLVYTIETLERVITTSKKKVMKISDIVPMIEEEVVVLNQIMKENFADIIRIGKKLDDAENSSEDVSVFGRLANFLRSFISVGATQVTHNIKGAMNAIRTHCYNLKRKYGQHVTVSWIRTYANFDHGKVKKYSSITAENGDVYPVYITTNLPKKTGSVASSVAVPGGEPIIIIDETLRELSKEALDFVIWHEAGHILAGHFNGRGGTPHEKRTLDAINTGKALTKINRRLASTIGSDAYATAGEQVPNYLIYLFKEIEADEKGIEMSSSKVAKKTLGDVYRDAGMPNDPMFLVRKKYM